MSKSSVSSFSVIKNNGENTQQMSDLVAVEEPLEIIIDHGPENNRKSETLAITMRTPGSDFELAMGFLATEQIIHGPKDVLSIRHCKTRENEFDGNSVKVQLSPQIIYDSNQHLRHFFINSSCGVCGKASIDAVLENCSYNPGGGPRISSKRVKSLPAILLENQLVFNRTGGLHAAGIFDQSGALLVWHEDVGRHNAVDKALGATFASGHWPLEQYLLLVSGRVSFELVQKSIRGGIKFMASIGAPSSLAVEMASKADITLLGFVNESRFNIYHGHDRVTDYVNVSQ